MTAEKEFCDSDSECVQSGLDGTLENSADSCGNTFFFFLTACYYRLSTNGNGKNMSGLESGVSLCVQAISPECLACHDYSPVDFALCGFYYIVSRVNLYIFPYVKS